MLNRNCTSLVWFTDASGVRLYFLWRFLHLEQLFLGSGEHPAPINQPRRAAQPPLPFTLVLDLDPVSTCEWLASF